MKLLPVQFSQSYCSWPQLGAYLYLQVELILFLIEGVPRFLSIRHTMMIRGYQH